MRYTSFLIAVGAAVGTAAALTAQPAAPATSAPVPAEAVASAPAAAPAGGLPEGPGHATFVRVCSGCHSPEVAAQQRLTPTGWKDIVEQMAANGAVATDAELAEITAYLAKSFPAAGE